MGFGRKAQQALERIDRQKPVWSHRCSHRWGFSSNSHFAAFLANEAQRELGFYRFATAALKAIHWKNELDYLIRLHREGGDRWLEGRLLASYVLLSRALRVGLDMRDRRPECTEEISANLIEASVRLLHLYRDTAKYVPVTRHFGLPARRIALDTLSGEGESLKNMLYDVWHVTRLGHELHGSVADELSVLARGLPGTRPSVFPETDNVLGYINSKRFELEQRLSASDKGWEELTRLCERIGDMPGLVKAIIGMGRAWPLNDRQRNVCRNAIDTVQWSWTVRRWWLRELVSVSSV
jgi:hypothetical protein